MNDLTKIPIAELEADLSDTIADIILCEIALSSFINKCGGIDVNDRLDDNIKIKNAINQELERRSQA